MELQTKTHTAHTLHTSMQHNQQSNYKRILLFIIHIHYTYTYMECVLVSGLGVCVYCIKWEKYAF